MKKVIIIQKSLPHYRVPFFSLLKNILKENGIVLELIYGKEKGKESVKNDEGELQWATFLPARYIFIAKRKVIWHGKLSIPFQNDLVIVENANKLVFNFYLLVVKLFTSRKVAFWGHSLNLQDNKHSVGNYVKRFLIKQADWWFAYTKNEKKNLELMGVLADHITAVENSIDTLELTNFLNDISKDEIEEASKKYRLSYGNTAIFIGGMYPEKRLSFLLECCRLIKNKVPGFNIFFLGNGEDAQKVKEASHENYWIHYIGTKKGREKALYLSLSDLVLMPGVVGLIVLDSFVSGVPMVTTNIHGHGPEIAYLQHGVNGMMTKDDAQAYSDEVITLLLDSNRLSQLRKGCRDSASVYTVENMAKNFADGIEQALNAGR